MRTRLVDLSTSGKPSGADVPPIEIALNHPRGSAGIFTGDRGKAVAAMAQAFEAWIKRQTGVAGIIAAGGSGGHRDGRAGHARAAHRRPEGSDLDRRIWQRAAYVGPPTS